MKTKVDVNALVNHICILSTTGLNKREFRDTVKDLVTTALREQEPPMPEIVITHGAPAAASPPSWQRTRNLMDEIARPTEPRMDCGHLPLDLVKFAPCDRGCAADLADGKHHLDCAAHYQRELTPYCRSCKQQAEAVAQARHDAEPYFPNAAAKASWEKMELTLRTAKERIAELERAVKEQKSNGGDAL